MSKLKWFIIGAMMVTVMAVLVGCGAKNDSESGSNSGSGNNNKSTVENLMTEAATGAKEMMTEAATGAKEMMSTAENGRKLQQRFHQHSTNNKYGVKKSSRRVISIINVGLWTFLRCK